LVYGTDKVLKVLKTGFKKARVHFKCFILPVGLCDAAIADTMHAAYAAASSCADATASAGAAALCYSSVSCTLYILVCVTA
jgi:hypothetical protein